MNSRPANVITDAEIREVEQLSQQLNQALQIERQMTAAAQNMDVSAANAAYQQLSQTIGNTERMIRDNTSEQRNFNDQIQKGQSEMDKLTGFIKKAAGAFLSFQTAKKIIDISDQMTSTTARLNLLVDSKNANETVDELQNKIFNSAQAARGSFGNMASFVARVGNSAGKAFTDNDELIKCSKGIRYLRSDCHGSAERFNSIVSGFGIGRFTRSGLEFCEVAGSRTYQYNCRFFGR